MDDFDRAQELEEKHRQQALAAFQSRNKVVIHQGNSDEPEEHFCDDCGDEIPKARLMIEPSAIRCVPCQTRFENMQARMK